VILLRLKEVDCDERNEEEREEEKNEFQRKNQREEKRQDIKPTSNPKLADLAVVRKLE
jgi:hypothetical protein